MSKYPACKCNSTRFDYFRRRYRNGTLHQIRRCVSCRKAAQNPMRQDEYDRAWVDSLPPMIEIQGSAPSPVLPTSFVTTTQTSPTTQTIRGVAPIAASSETVVVENNITLEIDGNAVGKAVGPKIAQQKNSRRNF